jgi:hypothetical protein
MSDNLLDMFVGSAIPHVYCKKVTLENDSENGEWTKVTLLFEMFQDRDAISSLSWLNDLNFSDNTSAPSLLDAFYIKVAAVSSDANMKKVKKSEVLKAGPTDYLKNVYVLKQHHPGADYFWSGENSEGEGLTKSLGPPRITGPDLPIKKIHVASSALLGDIKTVINNGPDDLAPRSIRQEYKNGKWYYVVPFQHTYTYAPSETNKNLAFVFYSYLDMQMLLGSYYMGYPDGSVPNPESSNYDADKPMVEVPYDSTIRMMNVEGTVNTEIIFENGQLAKTRESFIDYGSKLWEGPVHYHDAANPAPDGYVGFMAGVQHTTDHDLAKLQLVQSPNTKITDFRDSSVILPDSQQDHVLGMGRQVTFNISPNYENVENIIGSTIGGTNVGVLAPLQKEKKREFIPENFNEASKLYLTRDRQNVARGLFYIDFKNMLQNKSQLFSILSPDVTGKTKTGVGYQAVDAPEDATFSSALGPLILRSILNESKIVELRLYRDRVKPFRMRKTHKKFAKYKTHEEPSRLIGIIKDIELYKTSTSETFSPLSFFDEIELTNSADILSNRYFVFHDQEVRARQAGLYQYRIEIDFVDGTYSYINKILEEMEESKLILERYLDFALSGKNSSSTSFDYQMSYAKESAQKVYFEPYYDTNYRSFRAAFEVDATNEFGTEFAASLCTLLYLSYAHFIGHLDLGLDEQNLYNMMSPVTGSPEGILFCIRLFDSVLKKMHSLLGFNKKQKSINTLTPKAIAKQTLNLVHSPKTYDYKNNSAETLIQERHSFDTPDEVFDANKNPDFYADYLSTGINLSFVYSGLRSLTPEYYSDRCKLDTLKFCVNLEKAYSSYYIGTIPDPSGFSSMEHSYLTPSKIEVSDPGSFNKSYQYMYEPYSVTALSHLQNASLPFHSTKFLNYLNYDNVMMGAVLHTLNKNNSKDIDLSVPSVKIAENETAAAANAIQKTATYKKFFNNVVNLTLHNTEHHHSFFETNRFKTFTKDIEDKQEFPLKKENFSDFGIQTLNFYRNFMFDTEQRIKDLPRGNAVHAFSTNLPNSYKVFHYVNNQSLGATNTDSPNSLIKSSLKEGVFSDAQGPAATPKYNAFKFFNFNMTAAIEVFRGSGAHPQNDIWSLLGPQDINFVTDPNKVLFCRIKYWSKKLIGDLEIPIIDKYFLIYPGATTTVPLIQVSSEPTSTPLNDLVFQTSKPVDPAHTSSGRQSDQPTQEREAAPQPPRSGPRQDPRPNPRPEPKPPAHADSQSDELPPRNTAQAAPRPNTSGAPRPPTNQPTGQPILNEEDQTVGTLSEETSTGGPTGGYEGPGNGSGIGGGFSY